MKILVLVDDRIGSSKQAIAVADMLSIPYKKMKIEYTFWSKTPNIFGFHGATITASSKAKLLSANPDIIIAAGRRLARIAVWIKERKPNIKSVHILKPGIDLNKFDLLLLPKHDKKRSMVNHRKKIIFVDGAVANALRPLDLVYQKYWEDALKNMPKPLISVFIGGQTKGGVFMEHHARDLAKKVVSFATKTGGSLIVSNSRRTGHRLTQLIFDIIKKSGVNTILHDVEDDEINPYDAALRKSDYIIITGDSISMTAESIQAGKPVFIYAPSGALAKKHQRFVSSVIKDKQAQVFDGTLPEEIIYPSNQFKTLRDTIAKKLNLKQDTL
ncbi:MAG: ELM1/GtrOC1 family putative glycosyltransferase [Alphaproteobacteria bacterium]|jgi:mitochondrial fission protein ELM1